MIWQMFKAQWLGLYRDRTALFLVFLMPVILFTVFALIFGGRTSDDGGSAALRIAVLDQDDTDGSRRLISAVTSGESIELITAERLDQEGPDDGPPTQDDVIRLVRTNGADAAIILPAGFTDSIADFGSDRPPVRVIYDPANPLARPMLTGMLQGAAFTSVPDLLLEKGLEQLQIAGGPLTEQQRAATDVMLAALQQSLTADSGHDNGGGADQTPEFSLASGLVNVDAVSAMDTDSAREASDGRETSDRPDMVAYYAAAVAVMFLMFSMAGAASSLVEHEEKGTLERLLSGQMSVSKLVLSHWLFFVFMGVAGLAVMFLYASAVFGLDLFHVPQLLGSAVMAVVTAMASAGFVMMLATLCRTRKRLESISTIVILLMSAFGGSMAPKFIMPDFVQTTSLVAFNSWALDGFLKVFWYYDPATPILMSLAPQIVVILAMGAVFLGIAMLQARRWTVA